MNTLVIESTKDMPEVRLSSESGAGYIAGYSQGIDVFEFYENIELWIRNYAESTGSSFTLSCLLDYFNTSSSKSLDKLFVTLNALHLGSKHERQNIGLIWYYDENDDDSIGTAREWLNESDWSFPRDIRPYNETTLTAIREALHEPS